MILGGTGMRKRRWRKIIIMIILMIKTGRKNRKERTERSLKRMMKARNRWTEGIWIILMTFRWMKMVGSKLRRSLERSWISLNLR